MSAASRILARGEEMSFQKYAPTTDRRKGSTTWAASGSPVLAKALLVSVRESKDRGVTRGDQTLLVDGAKFTSEDLTEDWKVTIGSIEYKLSGPVVAARYRPSDRPMYYEARLETGGATLG